MCYIDKSVEEKENMYLGLLLGSIIGLLMMYIELLYQPNFYTILTNLF